MNGQSQIYVVAAVVGIIVIVAMALCFAILFYAYSKQRTRVISSGLDDKEVAENIEEEKKRYVKKLSVKYKNKKDAPLFAVANSRTFLEESQGYETMMTKKIYRKSLDYSHKRIKGWERLGDVVYALFIIIALALAGFGIYMSATGQDIFIGNTSYIVIETGSMETKNEDNAYLEEEGLDNQITQYSLIGIDKVDSIADIQMYDVIAFKDFDGNTIVHRVVGIHTDSETGAITLTTQGDANNGSADFEYSIGEDRLIGRWDGYQNYALGIIVTYLRSTLGIIALCGFGIFLMAYSIADSAIDRSWDERMGVVADDLDAKAAA